MSHLAIIDQLLDSPIPSIRYRTLVQVLGEDAESPGLRELQQAIRESDVVAALLRERDSRGRIERPPVVYGKWQGAHWALAALADIGYPPGDAALEPLRDQVQARWLADVFYRDFEAASKAAAYRHEGVPVMEGRHRRCASQQANALWSIQMLGLTNPQTHELAERLLYWQWPDGGWNCDKNPRACHSSFMESVLPLRALALYARRQDHAPARGAAVRAAEIFLNRHLYLGRRDGKLIRQEFVTLHYPLYWHYDVLHGLKVLAEAGLVTDPRCAKALDLLEHKRLPDGGWPAEARYYRTSSAIEHGNDHVDWGGTSKRRMNPWVTADALFVLRAAGRLNAPLAKRHSSAVSAESRHR